MKIDFKRTEAGKPDYEEPALAELAAEQRLPVAVIREAEAVLLSFTRALQAQRGCDFMSAAHEATRQRPRLWKIIGAERLA